MSYPMLEHLHTEDEIKDFAIDLIEEELKDLKPEYDIMEIDELNCLKSAIESDGYVDHSLGRTMNEILKRNMEQALLDIIGEEVPEFVPDLIIYGEVYKMYCTS